MAWHFARFTQQVTAAGKADARVADVRQRRADPAGLSTGPVSERGAAAPPDRRLARGRAWPSPSRRTSTSRPSSSGRRRPQRQRSSFQAPPQPRSLGELAYAFGEHDAIGFSPFAIEAISGPAATLRRPATTCSRRSARSSPGIRATARWRACCRSTDNRQPQQVRLNGYVLDATFERAAPVSLAEGAVIDPAGATAAPDGLPAVW